MDSCRLSVGHAQELQGEEVKHPAGTAAMEGRQQPGQLSRGVDGSRAGRQQGVAHVVHRGGQVRRRLLGHSAQVAGEGGDVGVPVVLPDARGKRCEQLLPVASDVIAVPENTWREATVVNCVCYRVYSKLS